MPERESSKGNPITLFVGGNVNLWNYYGKQYGVPLKSKNRVTLLSSNPTPRHISRRSETLIWKYTCTPIFIATLFTITKMWINPNIHQHMTGLRRWGEIFHIYGILVNHGK